ncbi:MAG: hypothetical protein ABIV26_02795 [Candidatus Limnocylindrales bacterium]
MNKKRGPGEAFMKNPRPGEQRDTEQDVEGHGLGDVLTRPLDGIVGQPTPGHDGLARMPRTGGGPTDDGGPEGIRGR